ncbi:unnamed protein product, partial [Effrenium voratum]
RGALPLRGRWPGAAGDRLRRRRLRARLVPRADAGGSPGRREAAELAALRLRRGGVPR